MSAGKCLICGADISAGELTCAECAEQFEPDKEILQAMLDRVPVECKGVKYGCISAYIIRTRVSFRVPLKKRYITQVELMSARTQSVTIAAPKEVKVLREFEK